MTSEEQKKMMELTKEVKRSVELNALEIKLLLEILEDYNKKIAVVNKMKKFRNNKEFNELRQVAKLLVDKLKDIHNQNKEEFEKLTELQKESIN